MFLTLCLASYSQLCLCVDECEQTFSPCGAKRAATFGARKKHIAAVVLLDACSRSPVSGHMLLPPPQESTCGERRAADEALLKFTQKKPNALPDQSVGSADAGRQNVTKVLFFLLSFAVQAVKRCYDTSY